MSDYSKTRIFKENSSRVLEIHNVVYQVGQGCPINAKLEFSVENSSRWCKYTTLSIKSDKDVRLQQN